MFWGVKIDNVNCERRKAGQQKEKESLKSSLQLQFGVGLHTFKVILTHFN